VKSVASELQYRVIRLVEANPEISQRTAAKQLGISLGRVNYCVRALIHRGWIKVINFKNSQNKAAYRYLLTPRGIREKSNLTVHFLRIKTFEYERLKEEIEEMKKEAGKQGSRNNTRQQRE